MRREAIQTLLDTLEGAWSTFLLGAGASAGLVPMARELGPLVAKRVLSVGVFPASPIPRDAITDRILGPAPTLLDVEGELIGGHLAPGAVHAATAAILRPALPEKTPSHYGVFALARKTLTILNLNNDGFAGAYCTPRHQVINLHGTSLSPEERGKFEWEHMVDALQQFPAVRAPRIPGLLLPQVEPPLLAETPIFRAAAKSLRQTRRLAIVGYSFGEGDDWLIERMVVDAMKSSALEVVVVSPDPSGLAARLESLGMSDVCRLPARWGELSASIVDSIGRHFFKSCSSGRLCARCIGWLYGGACDAI